MAGWLLSGVFRTDARREEEITKVPEPQSMGVCFGMEISVGLPRVEEREEPCCLGKKGLTTTLRITRVVFT